MDAGERGCGDVRHGNLFTLNVDALFGRLLVRAPISCLGDLERLCLPDGTYSCEATPRRLNGEDVVLVNGRMIIAKDAIVYLHKENPFYRFFSYLSLSEVREVLQSFERLEKSEYRQTLKALCIGRFHGVVRAKKIYLSELLTYHVLVENVAVLMGLSIEESQKCQNPLAGIATRFSTRVCARDYLAGVYQRMRVLVKRARSGRITKDEKDEYADLRLNAIALELLMKDPKWPQ